MSSQIKYNLTTYTVHSHNYLIAKLNSMSVKFEYVINQTDESYSKFVVYSDSRVYEIVRTLIEEGNGTAISIEYGA